MQCGSCLNLNINWYIVHLIDKLSSFYIRSSLLTDKENDYVVVLPYVYGIHIVDVLFLDDS